MKLHAGGADDPGFACNATPGAALRELRWAPSAKRGLPSMIEGGCIRDDHVIDRTFNGSMPVTYKVRPIFVDAPDDGVRGCGDETATTIPSRPQNLYALRWQGWE
jgi:hypothetical protein